MSAPPYAQGVYIPVGVPVGTPADSPSDAGDREAPPQPGLSVVADRLNALLAEYSTKLRAVELEYGRRRGRMWVSELAALAGVLWSVIGGNVVAPFLRPSSHPSPTFATVSVAIVVTVLGAGVAAFAFAGSEAIIARGLRIELDAGAASLSRLVAGASQLNEHTALDLGRRLEFETRLAEAEALLQHVAGAPRRGFWLDALIPGARRRAADRAARRSAWDASARAAV